MAAARTAIEVRRRRAEPDELHVHVPACRVRVAKQATVAVNGVQAGIRLEAELGAAAYEPGEFRRGFVAPALDAELGRVYLDEPHPDAVGEEDRVAVSH